MAPGFAFMIGLIGGAAIVYLVMQSKLKQRERALAQSRHDLEHTAQAQAQRLHEVSQQLQIEYEQQLTATLEQYQNDHSQKLATLTAEYEARLAVLTTPRKPAQGGLGPLPDPWDEVARGSELPAITDPPHPPAVISSELDLVPPMQGMSTDRSALVRPDGSVLVRWRSLSQGESHFQWAKLSKDPDPAVRLTVIETLKQSGSSRSLPIFRQALRDPDLAVVAAASEAISRFKGTRLKGARPQAAQKTLKKLPKNH